jgi:hypothetical protein
MWTGYPQPIRSEIDAVTRDSGVIHVLPITTAETGSPSIKRTKRVEDVTAQDEGDGVIVR